jgi:predicted  nucleic acid-binding Zn-ribbon protein
MNSCGSNREYQTLKEQIAADEKANSVLADEIFEALEKIDQLQADTARQEAERERAAAELESLRQSVSEQQTQLQAELQRVTNELRQSETALPAEIKVEYDRIARARGEEALAQVDSETCSGCYQMLSAQTMNSLLLGRAIFCKSCGALLYLKEDSSPTA